jgi:formate C-acetyltransferase
MKYIKDKDYDYIMNKYHDATKAETSYRFMANEKIFDESTGISPEQIHAHIGVIEEKYANHPHCIIKARAFEYILDNTKISCDARDIFPAICSIDRTLWKTLISKWEQEVFNDRIPETIRKKKELESRGALNIYIDYDHSMPNWERLFNRGIPGIIEDADIFKAKLETKKILSPEEISFYEAIKIEYEAFNRLIIRMAKLAEINNPKLCIALCRLSTGKPETFYEALLLSYLFFIVIEHIDCMQARSLGNFDRLFAPYYFDDIEKGKSEEALREELAYYLLQFQSINNYWGQPTYLGGTKKDGSTVINEFSYVFLDVYDKMGIYNPKLQLKISNETPKSIVLKALDMIRRGNNSIVFVCDKTVRAAFEKVGIDYDIAREYDITGCYAAYIQDAVPICSTYLNIMKPLEYTISGGYDAVTGNPVGLKTSTDFESYDAFYNCYLLQLKECLESVTEIEYAMSEFTSYINPQSLLSGVTLSSIENGIDILGGGATRANTTVCCGGIANVCDSLAAIRELVFESKRYTLKELKDILDSDFKDNESLRLEMIHKLPHFGNNDDSVDEIVKNVLSFICNTVTGKKNRYGYNYRVDTHVARHSYIFGKHTAASPDGRHFGDELSKNSSATIGRAVNGPTAAILSTTKINCVDLCGGDSCLDLGLHPTAVKGEDGLEAMYSMLMVYAARGGFAMHINVFDADTLRDAQANPEKYEDLQIRVSGWNVLWNNINKEEQDGFIHQAEGLI